MGTNIQCENIMLHQLAALVSGRFSPKEVHNDSWPELAELALKHGLAPMLVWSVKQAGMDSLPCGKWPILKKTAYHTALVDIEFENHLRTVTQAFKSSDIPAAWLKGADLARSVYPQSGLRPMGDLDILVPYEMRDAALQVLLDLKYELVAEDAFRSEKSGRHDEEHLKRLAFHHYMLAGGKSKSIIVELHFNLMTFGNDRLLSKECSDWFFKQTRSFHLSDNTVCIGLTPEAHVLYLCAHNIFQHGEARACLMRDLDLHLLVSREQLNWELIIDRAEFLGWTGAVKRSLERAISLFATPVPETVLAQFFNNISGHEELELAFQKKTPGSRWVRVRKNLSQLSARGRINYFLKNIFPAARYMRYRYAVPTRRSIWPYYPYRWLDQSLEISRAIWRRRKKTSNFS